MLEFGTNYADTPVSVNLNMLRGHFSSHAKAAEVRMEPKWSWCYNKALRKAAGCIVTSL